ncbi:cell division cycle protein 48 [Teratosphaeria destructans]|uniref:Cell division cycle protein 48 n=1 Tax=Teratosphaeria destructans TaxID=418781 RepID=A0A9W7T148_9PEZI|nr:cell division cycle protein 48 [Teratosphaeria destructans]
MATDMEPFMLVEENAHNKGTGNFHLFDDVVRLSSATIADHDLPYIKTLREAHPGYIVTAIPQNNIPLRSFAAAGFATCDLDKETDSFASWRGFNPPALRQNRGSLAENVFFAKYHYKWNSEDFVLFTVSGVQYILKERRGDEHPLGPSKITDTLIQTVGDWLLSDQSVVWVFDNYWQRSKALFQEVQKASWDKVILDEAQKGELTSVANTFFSSKNVYEDLGVPWKRGLMFYGPPGNGKTVSIKALMHTLLSREDPIPTLYVKHAPQTFHIRLVFAQARELAPCMLVLEDVETIVTPETRSYFFNELDGLENNDGLFVVASTNYLDRLDPGLTKRPSRFDRKYLFPLPNEHERTLYCEYWRHKLSKKPSIKFPETLCPAMAHITPDFSFAFMQECFVATLLNLARGEMVQDGGDDGDLDKYELWRVFKQQADVLRKEVNGSYEQGTSEATGAGGLAMPVPADDVLLDLQAGTAVEGGVPDLRHLHVLGSDDEMLPRLGSGKSQVFNPKVWQWK